MQKNELNLHIYGIHLLNPYKTVVSHLNLKLCKYHIGARVDLIDFRLISKSIHGKRRKALTGLKCCMFYSTRFESFWPQIIITTLAKKYLLYFSVKIFLA